MSWHMTNNAWWSCECEPPLNKCQDCRPGVVVDLENRISIMQNLLEELPGSLEEFADSLWDAGTGSQSAVAQMCANIIRKKIKGNE